MVTPNQAPKLNTKHSTLNTSVTMRILVIAPAWVGDTVMAQPLFRLLHQRHANLALDVLAPPFTLPLLARMPEVRRGIVARFGHGDWRASCRPSVTIRRLCCPIR
jgi:ADP-heptose:LPS heptosyltransferase